ncbi:MAG: flagellar filament capping protein FliD [Bryobacterales bacterium]|nr:flagellar filament capping protein FliD [Bryobacterales bacterium]
MSLTPLAFTGVSTFSSDLQTILSRATSIASLPIQALQNQQKDIVQQKLLVTNLNTAVAALASSVSNLGNIGRQKALVASSSDSATVSATNISAPGPAVYTISDITSVAKAAAETSAGYADTTSAVSLSGTVKLVAGASEYTIDLTGRNNLTGLRDAINNLGAGVTATVLTTGTGATPYYLSVTANNPGATTLQLIDDPGGAATSLLSAGNQGADTVFKLNGVDVRKNTTLINDVVPGVTFNILDTTSGGETVHVTVASSRSQMASALSDFVNAYNGVADQVNAQVGRNAGLLSGDFLIRETQDKLRGLASYTGASGSVKGLADLGIEFDSGGVATLNQTTFNNLSDSRISDALNFLGSTTDGFGGLAAGLANISDSATGLAKIQLDNYDAADRRLSDQIATLTSRASEMQKSLAARLQAADALLASLQSQQSIVTAQINSLNYTLYGKQTNQ